MPLHMHEAACAAKSLAAQSKKPQKSVVEEKSLKRLGLIAALVATGCIALSHVGRAAGGEGEWLSSGHDVQDTRSAKDSGFSFATRMGGLTQRWAFTAAGDISSTPTVEGNAVYFVDWGGIIYRLNRDTGTQAWKAKISDYTGNPASVSRTSPAIGSNVLVFGDQAGGTVMAVNKQTGALVWKTTVDSHPLAVITGAPIIQSNTVYVGVASSEEGAAANPGYGPPSFRGSVVALDLRTGETLWKTTTVPTGYTGGAVWGTVSVDVRRKTIYAGTGNNYSVPASVAACITAAVGVPAKTACLNPADYVDSAIALDMDTGSVKWSNSLEGPDTWTVGCLFIGLPCPVPSGPDYDFGSGPNLINLGGNNNLVGIGQKSGIYWALNPDTGSVVWATKVGPGSSLGGIEWGTASDGSQVYVAISNRDHAPYTLAGGTPSKAGSWAALDAATGQIAWQVPTPGNDARDPSKGSLGLGAVSVVGGVMFAAATSGTLVGLDTATGKTLWSFESGVTTISGPSVVDDEVFWGTGYSHFGIGTPGKTLYSFGLE